MVTAPGILRPDKIAFGAFSDDSGTTRYFTRFSEALKEVIDARVWGGIHFRTADMQGSVIGMKVSHYLVKHFFGACELSARLHIDCGRDGRIRALHFGPRPVRAVGGRSISG